MSTLKTLMKSRMSGFFSHVRRLSARQPTTRESRWWGRGYWIRENSLARDTKGLFLCLLFYWGIVTVAPLSPGAGVGANVIKAERLAHQPGEAATVVALAMGHHFHVGGETQGFEFGNEFGIVADTESAFGVHGLGPLQVYRTGYPAQMPDIALFATVLLRCTRIPH